MGENVSEVKPGQTRPLCGLGKCWDSSHLWLGETQTGTGANAGRIFSRNIMVLNHQRIINKYKRTIVIVNVSDADPGCLSRNTDPGSEFWPSRFRNFYPSRISDPSSRGQKGTGSRTRTTGPTSPRICKIHIQRPGAILICVCLLTLFYDSQPTDPNQLQQTLKLRICTIPVP